MGAVVSIILAHSRTERTISTMMNDTDDEMVFLTPDEQLALSPDERRIYEARLQWMREDEAEGAEVGS